MKEKLTTAVLVGSIALSGCIPEKRRCPAYSSSIELGAPKVDYFSPKIIISAEAAEKLYQEWGLAFTERQIDFSPQEAAIQAADFMKVQLRQVCGSDITSWEERINQLTSNAQFLAPFEFAVRLFYGDEKREEELLSLYQTNRQAAIGQLLAEQVFDKSQEEVEFFSGVVQAVGFYDEQTDRILMNSGAFTSIHNQELARNALVHEAWHGLPGVRTFQLDGAWFKVSGLAVEFWDGQEHFWRPSRPKLEFGFTTQDVNHALVFIMDPFPDPSQLEGSFEAIAFVNQAFEVLGKEEVIKLYLDSRAGRFYRLVEDNCQDFSEFLQEGTNCP